MFSPHLLEKEKERGTKVGDFTDVEAMHVELEAVHLKAHEARQEAAQREEALRSRLSSALGDRQKAIEQSADLAAKLAHVQKQLEDEKGAKSEMAMAKEDALKTVAKQREMQEAASASAGTCSLVLDDTRFTVIELEDTLRAVLNGEAGLAGWRLDRAKVGWGTGGRLVSKGRGRGGRTRLLSFTLPRKNHCCICNVGVAV